MESHLEMGGGGAKQKTFRGGSMDIFWNCTLVVLPQILSLVTVPVFLFSRPKLGLPRADRWGEGVGGGGWEVEILVMQSSKCLI